MILKAIIRLANRYAEAAEELAAAEKDAGRKKQLEQIAEACRRVPANSPKSFYQAMQSLWFNQILSSPTSTHNLGRFDQYMYPFYKEDLKKGRINDEEVLDFIMRITD